MSVRPELILAVYFGSYRIKARVDILIPAVNLVDVVDAAAEVETYAQILVDVDVKVASEIPAVEDVLCVEAFVD